MAEVEVTHEEHSGSEIHLPDPSPWPFIAGVALLIAGLALVWWSRERDSALAGVALGAGIMAVAFTVAGWAIEDSGMLRKAKQQGHGHGPRQARYTQVVTFAVPESAGDEAAAAVIAELENATSTFHNLDGFQDLRIVASPSDAGAAQVLVETTWSGRSELEGYASSQQTVLDIINNHPAAVVPGTVQTFDMEVVRDTKDVAFRFSLGGAAILFGALAVGGIVLAAGLSVFQEEGAGGGGQVPADNGGGGGGGGAFDGTIAGINTLFVPDEFEVPPSTEITLTFDNQDAGVNHNIEIFSTAEPGAGDLLTGCIEGCQEATSGAPTDQVVTEIAAGPAQHTFTFTTPADEGDYGIWCLVHSTSMLGTMHVVEGAPVPGGAPAPAPGGDGGGAASGSTVDVGDNYFAPESLSVPVGTTVTWDWSGAAIHNVVSTDGGPLESDLQTEGTYEFTFDEAGTYEYFCEVHPTDMIGTIEVTG